METIIYKITPKKRYTCDHFESKVYEYYEGDHTICFIRELSENDPSIYKYYIPTDQYAGMYFVNEIDALNFGANAYQFGFSEAFLKMGKYTEAQNRVFSDESC
jgi:hypothetical protein